MGMGLGGWGDGGMGGWGAGWMGGGWVVTLATWRMMHDGPPDGSDGAMVVHMEHADLAHTPLRHHDELARRERGGGEECDVKVSSLSPSIHRPS